MQSHKQHNDLSVSKATIQYHSNSSLRPKQLCWRSWRWTVLWRPTRPSRTNTQKRCPFHYRGLEWKTRNQELPGVTQIWPWRTEWSRAKANRVLPREYTGHSKHRLRQNKRRLYMWTSPGSQYWNQIDYILSGQRWRSSIQSAKTRQGTDCGSDHELLIAKFRLKLKKIGITTRPFRYDLNQIPYNYTVEVRNRFKQLELRDKCLKKYGRRFVAL